LTALLLALLAASPLLDPIFGNFVPGAQASGPEEQFLSHMIKVLDDFTKELRIIARDFLMKMKVPPEKIGEELAELAVVMKEFGEDYFYTWKDIGLQYKTWAENAVQILLQKGVIEDSTEASRVLDALQGARKIDALITKAKVLKDVVGGGKMPVDIIEELGGKIPVETKAVASNKAHTIAEMLRDILYSWRTGRTVVYLTPNTPPPPYTTDTYTWTKRLLRECADALYQASGGAVPKEIVGDIADLRFVATEEGIVAQGPRVVVATKNGLLGWLGSKVGMLRFIPAVVTTVFWILIDLSMRSPLASCPPVVVVADVGYDGLGEGGRLTVTLTYWVGDTGNGHRAVYFELGAWLNVSKSIHWLGGFDLPVLLSDGSEFKDPEPYVAYPSNPPARRLPYSPVARVGDGSIALEWPLKVYTTPPDSSGIVYQYLDVLVVEIQVEKYNFLTGDPLRHYTVKRAVVEQRVLSSGYPQQLPPFGQLEPPPEPSPAPPTPYVTVKASVASGCGRVTVVPQLWFYPSGPEVSVPNGSLVVLRAYPCEGCSLRYWLLSDGQRTWTDTGAYVGLRVNRSLTALAYFTDPPQRPKLVVRAESSEGAPVYVNVSGWVLWRGYDGAVYNTTVPGDVIIGGLDFTLRHDTPLGFRVVANKTAVWVGVPVWYGGYAVTLTGPCSYCYLEEGLPTLSGLHLLLVWAKGSGGYARVDSGWVYFNDYYGTCQVIQGGGAVKRALGYCIYTGTYNYNNQKPTIVLSDAYADSKATYRIGRKTQLKLLRWELRGPEGVIARWYDPEAYLPAWYNSTSYRWEGTLYPLYSKPDATYELVAIYGPPQATLTAKVSAVLPDGSRVYLSSVRVNATTVGASASALTDGSGIAKLSLPTGNPVAIYFPRVINYAPYRLVVENVTYNGACLGGLTYINDATSMILPSFDKDGTVEIAYRAVAPLVVYWGPGGSVQPGFQQVVNGTTVYAENGMPVALVTKPASGYEFGRWLIVKTAWVGQSVSKSGTPWNGVLWVDTKYTGAWRVDAFFDFEPFYPDALTNVNLYVEAVDAQGRVRTLTSRSLWLQWSGRQQVTLSWTGELYNEWLRMRLASDKETDINLMRLTISPAVYTFTGESASGGGYVKNAEVMTQHRFEGPVRVSVNFTTNPVISNYQWRLRLLAVGADGSERELFATGWYTGSTRSLSLTWTGSLKDEWVKAVVESNDGSSYKSLSVYAAPQLPANATVLYRWPVQLKAEFTQG